RPSACKADALNQLSYAPKHFPSKRECKDMNILRTFKFFSQKKSKLLQRSCFEMFAAVIYSDFSSHFQLLKSEHSRSYVTDEAEENGRKGT
ncbi:MAG: hypothetical protein ACI4AE_01615, partial [Candidatus Cryptobacteroides sp.]